MFQSPVHRLRSPPPPPPPPPSSPPPLPSLPPFEDIKRNRLHLQWSHSTIRRQTAIHTLTDDVYDGPLTPPATPPPLREGLHSNLTLTGDEYFSVTPKRKTRLNDLALRVPKEADAKTIKGKDRLVATPNSPRTPPIPLLLTPPPTPSPQTQHHPNVLPKSRARFRAPKHFPSTSAIPKQIQSSSLLTQNKKATEQDRPAPARWRGFVIEEEDDERSEMLLQDSGLPPNISRRTPINESCSRDSCSFDVPLNISAEPAHTWTVDVPVYLASSKRDPFPASLSLMPSQDRVQDEDDEEEVLYPSGPSRLRLPYDTGYVPETRLPMDDNDRHRDEFDLKDRPSNTSESYLQQDADDSFPSALSDSRNNAAIEYKIPAHPPSSRTPPSLPPGSSTSRLPTVRKWLKAGKKMLLSSPSPSGDGVSYMTASLSHSNISPISYPQDQAIVDALLDASRESGPWHILDATTNELVKKVATVLSKSEIYDQLSDLPVIQAQSTLDFLQDLLDIRGLPLSYKRAFLNASLKLARVHNCVPRCLTIGGFKTTGNYPFARGHFGDLWRGEVEGTEVAIKRGRIFTGENNIAKVFRKMTREAIIWGQCDHPNVLPFYGIYRDSAPSSFCLVSPFMANGPLRQYLSNTDKPDRHRLALDITRGMDYLHKMTIVHGDLKGDNILITDDHRAVIADFGISFAMGITRFGTSSSRKGGTVKWQPPEVLKGNPNSFSADVYSLACVYFEVFDGTIPWSDLNDGVVIMNVSVWKKRPPCPKHLAKTDLWWELMVRCWAYEPSHRPTLQNLMECLHVTGDTLPPRPEWDKPDLTRLRGPLVLGKLHIPSDLPSFLNAEGISYLADPGPHSVTSN